MMHFSTSDENFRKKVLYSRKVKFLNSIPLEFLKSIHFPQTRLRGGGGGQNDPLSSSIF